MGFNSGFKGLNKNCTEQHLQRVTTCGKLQHEQLLE